jgi:hypothetical protein
MLVEGMLSASLTYLSTIRASFWSVNAEWGVI